MRGFLCDPLTWAKVHKNANIKEYKTGRRKTNLYEKIVSWAIGIGIGLIALAFVYIMILFRLSM